MAAFLTPSTLLRMALDATRAGQWRYAGRCWTALENHAGLAEVPGDELQRIYAAACVAGQTVVAHRMRCEILIRARDSRKEPLVSGARNG